MNRDSIFTMRLGIGRIVEIQSDVSGKTAARVICPVGMIPRPGQYLLAYDREDKSQVLSEVVFPSEISHDGFLSAPGIPEAWNVGTRLSLRGPLGRGFSLDGHIRRLVLVSFGESVTRLLPLMETAFRQKAAVAIFADCPLPTLPASVEAFPLVALPEALPWAEMVALEVPFEKITGLRKRLGMQERFPCPTQVLVTTAMPCGGMAECGACAVQARRGWKLACKDGPVFDQDEIDIW